MTRCEKGRICLTRQMSLSLRSIVETKASAVKKSAPAPSHPNCPAFAENCCMYVSTDCAISLGIRLSTNQRSTEVSNFEKAGSTLKIASATVNKGTKAITVVKVKLLAASPRRSALNRSRMVSPVVRHGKRAKSWRTSCQKRCQFPHVDDHCFMSVSCQLTSKQWT